MPSRFQFPPQLTRAGLPTRVATSWIIGLALTLAAIRNVQADEAAWKAGTNLPVFSNLAIPEPDFGLGQWIWGPLRLNQQSCRLWNSFEIPEKDGVVRARLRITADDSFRLFLDGREVGMGGTWMRILEFDLTAVLSPGPHVLAIDAFNDTSFAGVILGMHIDLKSGKAIHIVSDRSWRLVPNELKNWEKITRADPDWLFATQSAVIGKSDWPKKPLVLIPKPAVLPVVLQFWQTGWFQITMLTVCLAGALIIMYLVSQLAMQAKAQRFLQRERARIARDIHDDVGARLTQLVLLTERAQKELPPEVRHQPHLDEIGSRSRDILDAMDEVVWTVNSRHDTVQDFEAYVCNYAEAFLKDTALRCRLDVATEIPAAAFDLAIRRNLFLAIKEALNNAVKYSGGTELNLRIHLADQEILVVVEDNGRGFSPATANPCRNGLTNMAQRIAEVGGTCQVVSQPGKGCRIEFRTPLIHARSSRFRWWKGHWQRQQEAAAEQDRAQVIAAHTAGEVSKL